MTNQIDDIIKRSQENGDAEEIYAYIDKLEFEKEELKRKNQRLQIEKSSSKAEQYRKSNQNMNERNKKLTDKVNKLRKKRDTNLAHLSHEQIGVYERMLTDFESSIINHKRIIFPGIEHPIFNKFAELGNKYPNREFIVVTLGDKIKEKKDLVDFEIKTQKKNIDLIKQCQEAIEKFPDTWEEEVDKRMAYLYKVTTIEEINKRIEELEADKVEIDKWIQIKDLIIEKPKKTNTKRKNLLFFEIFDEFDRVFEFCKHVGGVAQYKANIHVNSFNKDELYSSLTRELEKQVGLCEEPYTHNFFYNNGEGRLIPYELNRRFLQYINENTLFIKSDGKKNQYKSGNIINSKVLFTDVPLYCNKIQYRNQNLIGFNNCFYDINSNEVISLNPQAPIMPLKNTKTELYLEENNKIGKNPMQEIFEKCFSKEDAKTILAYLGCALFDKGYTQRQESLFLMGRGGTGKSTFIKAICSIFYNVGSQLVSKFKDSNEFSLSVFADNDVVIIDEVQSAPKEFANKLKEISSTGDLPVEKKHFDTILIPRENVPRMFLIGNNFSKKLYEESDNQGVRRRILIVIPIKEIQSLGFKWIDLIQPACQQWLVQNAIKVYKELELDKASVPISTISEKEKENRLEMCVYPEQFFVKKHFKVVMINDTTYDRNERTSYTQMFNFIRKQIDKHYVEATCKESAENMFISEVKKAFKLPRDNYHTATIDGEIYFPAIVPASDEAIKEIKG